jgi:hypothetical protein
VVFVQTVDRARHLGNLTLEQQSRLDKLRHEIVAAGYVERTDDVTLVWPLPKTTYICIPWTVRLICFFCVAAFPAGAEIRCAEGFEHVHRMREVASRIPGGTIETFVCI